MKDIIQSLKDFINLLESQIPNRELYYKNFVDKKIVQIKEQIDRLEKTGDV